MDDNSSDPFERLSTDEILEKLTRIIQNLGNPWISWERVEQQFFLEVGASLEDCLGSQCNPRAIKRFLRESRLFSIYEKPDFTDFYIALMQDTVPYPSPISPQKSSSYRVKRRWKVDYHIAKMIRTEFGQSHTHPPASKDQSNTRPIPKLRQRDVSFLQDLPSQIDSKSDLERALVILIRYLARGSQDQGISIDQLSRYFLANYKTPIRSIARQYCPSSRLVNLLETIPQFRIEGSGSDLRIFLTDAVDDLDKGTSP
ncbi:hypothetical protein [Trichothermofontia sp.]